MSGRDANQPACRHCGLPAEGAAALALQVDEQGRTECWCGEHDDRKVGAMRVGDVVTVVLSGAGVETREEATVVRVTEDEVLTDESDYGYDPRTLRWLGPDFGGFTRRIEASDA